MLLGAHEVQVPPEAKVTLWLQLIDLWHEHELALSWNGAWRTVDLEKDWHRKGSSNVGEMSFSLRPQDVKTGDNLLSLKLLKRPANLDHFITLNWVLLHIDP